jgi:uncharacterized protein (DUF362 family)/NAD-dependent dihydropyrimidine dehydrogenase PreA subunit
METVSISKAASYRKEVIRASMQRLLEPLGGIGAFIRPGERVLIKPNLLAARPPEKAVTTHPAIVRELILLVRQAGAIPLVGDSPGIGGLRKVAERSGILAVLEETKTELVAFDEIAEVSSSGTFKRFELARPYLEADKVINLPKLKTHEMMTMTCGVKNLFGAVVGTAKAAWHLKAGANRELFAKMLVEIHQLRPPDLTIVDAVTAMEGDGPGSGDPRFVGCLLAGRNALSVDLVAADILNIPHKLRYVERAAEKLGLPGVNRDNVRTTGASIDEVRISDFRLPQISDVQFGLPDFLKNRLKHQLSSRPVPLSDKCVLCGICQGACPPQAMEIMNGKLIIDYKLCIRCFCCRELCPHAALTVKEGVILKVIKKYL